MTAPAATRVELVDWHRLAPAERESVASLEISAEQIEFAGPVERSIAACEAGGPAEVAGLAIRADGDIVGWVLLKRGPSVPAWADSDAVVVGGLRITQRRQGHGIGAASVAALAPWVSRHWPTSTRLMLRVDDGNTAGIRAYEKAGWREVGERRVGRVGIERTLQFILQPA